MCVCWVCMYVCVETVHVSVCTVTYNEPLHARDTFIYYNYYEAITDVTKICTMGNELRK